LLSLVYPFAEYPRNSGRATLESLAEECCAGQVSWKDAVG